MVLGEIRDPIGVQDQKRQRCQCQGKEQLTKDISRAETWSNHFAGFEKT